MSKQFWRGMSVRQRLVDDFQLAEKDEIVVYVQWEDWTEAETVTVIDTFDRPFKANSAIKAIEHHDNRVVRREKYSFLTQWLIYVGTMFSFSDDRLYIVRENGTKLLVDCPWHQLGARLIQVKFSVREKQNRL